MLLASQSESCLRTKGLGTEERRGKGWQSVTDAKGLARQLQQVHCSAHSSLKQNINSINQLISQSYCTSYNK
jgi:hypothetical protein